MATVLVLIALLSSFWRTECAHQAVANFNARGIAGSILFTEVEGGVRIKTSLKGLRTAAPAHAGDGGHDDGGHDNGGDSHGHGGGSGYLWHVHNLPVDQTVDPAVQCLGAWVGPHYDPFNARAFANYSERCTTGTPQLCEAGDLAGKFGNLMPHMNLNVTDMTGELTLSGPYSIVGRSVVVHSNIDGTNFECGTIQLVEQTEDAVTLLQATFTYPMAGVVYFKQVGSEDVSIWGKLYWANGNQRTVNHTWSITDTAPGEGHRGGMCDDVGNRYDPDNRTPAPNPTTCLTNASFCEIGDLSQRLGFLTIAASPGPVYQVDSFFFTDSSLVLSSVRNRSISIGQPDMGDSNIGCAPLIDVETITLRQPVDGFFTVSQRGPYEETIVTTTTLPSRSISVLSAAFNPIENCPQEGVVFDPYTKTHLTGEDTPDKYPLGDWQNRYQSRLSNGSVIRLFDVPVYGASTSISSRSVRYVTGSTRTCTALIPMLRGNNVVLAKAAFSGSGSGNSDFNGAVYFVQEDFGFGQLGSTHVIADLSFASQRNPTSYNWDVRQNNAQTSEACGDTFNPFLVSTGIVGDSPNIFSNYSADCSPSYPLRCQSGDLTGKHGQLVVASDVTDRPTFTFVDPNIHLTGMFSILGQSVGLSAGSGLAGCAQIRRAYVSSRAVFVRTDRDAMLRTGIARRLASGTSADVTDILVLRQEVFSIGFQVLCLNVTVRVLGPTQQEADMNAAQVADNANDFVCNHAIPSVASLSIATWTLCFILVLFASFRD